MFPHIAVVTWQLSLKDQILCTEPDSRNSLIVLDMDIDSLSSSGMPLMCPQPQRHIPACHHQNQFWRKRARIFRASSANTVSIWCHNAQVQPECRRWSHRSVLMIINISYFERLPSTDLYVWTVRVVCSAIDLQFLHQNHQISTLRGVLLLL
jgi:hypothetical protein